MNMHVLVAHDNADMTCCAGRTRSRRSNAQARARLLRRVGGSGLWRSLKFPTLRLYRVGSHLCSLVSPGGALRMVSGVAAHLQSLRLYLHPVTHIYSTRPSQSPGTSFRRLYHHIHNPSSTAVPPFQSLRPETSPCHLSRLPPPCARSRRRRSPLWKRKTSRCRCPRHRCQCPAPSPHV